MYRRDISHLFGPNTTEDVMSLLLSAQPHYLEAAFDEIDQAYGSFETFLECALEIDETKRERLLELLTEA